MDSFLDRRRIAALFALLAVIPSAPGNSDSPVRSMLPDPFAEPCPGVPVTLEHLSGNLFRHVQGEGAAAYTGLVLVTKEGALVVDPARTCTATRLRDTIRDRFHVRVKYVVYTHAHFDHIGGGQVFQKDGATIIAQKNALDAIVGERLPTAVPDRLFDQQMTITLGGEIVKLYHIAPSHSDSLALVYFPKYRALQCTDVCGADSLPYNDFPDFYYDGWIRTLEWLRDLPVDLIDVGHHALAKKPQQEARLQYLLSLHSQVLELVRQGQPWDQVYRNVRFKEEVRSWSGFENQRLLNILGMHRWVTQHRRGLW